MTTYTKPEEELEEKEEESSMSFLDHLDELRSRLIRSAAFVLVAFIICFYFSDAIYNFLEIPVRAAMLKSEQAAGFGIKSDVNSIWDLPDGAEVDFALPTDARVGGALIQTGGTIRVKVRVNENGSRDLITTKPLIINTATVLPEGTVIPMELYSTTSGSLNPDNKLNVGTVQGAFNLYIKVSFYAAIFFAVPFLLTQVWGFVAPGLYPHEKKYAAPFIIMTSLFFLIGCAFAYYIAFPRAADFLLGVAAEGELRPLVMADDYFDLIILIMLGLGLIFEIPTVTYFLSRLGIITPQMLIRFWKFALIIIFIVAAILSPTTDIPNLLVFAAPMMILYSLSIGIAWVFYRKRHKEEDVGE
ncbi:MAG TPA: twin-arginine translocase subunit TatC [Blastocatellia bacterium]|nr:twin-arginine translocase subunit TatC [Blastocatellia bacterium]